MVGVRVLVEVLFLMIVRMVLVGMVVFGWIKIFSSTLMVNVLMSIRFLLVSIRVMTLFCVMVLSGFFC